jgi:hypothetical protein
MIHSTLCIVVHAGPCSKLVGFSFKDINFILTIFKPFFYLQVIEEEKLQQNSLQVGTYFLKGLEQLQEQYPVIGDVRGKVSKTIHYFILQLAGQKVIQCSYTAVGLPLVYVRSALQHSFPTHLQTWGC